MKLSQLLHLLSAAFGIAGLGLWLLAVVGPGAFGQTQQVMLTCGALAFLAAIWLILAAMYHKRLEVG